MQKFIHLRNISSYSLCNGALKISDLTMLAKKYKMPAIALTDINNLFGSLEFSIASSKTGIQPIIGVSLNIEISENEYDQILVLAKNEIGYKNLLTVASSAYLEASIPNINYIPISKLENHSEGLIVIAGYHRGKLYNWVSSNQEDKVDNLISTYKKILPNHLYLEISRLGYHYEKTTEQKLLKKSIKFNLPIVATNDTKYASRDLAEAQEILNCIATNSYYDDPNREQNSSEHYFKTTEEMVRLFSDLPEAIENTTNIAKRCSYFPKIKDPSLPHFETNQGRNEDEELSFQAKEGLEAIISKLSLTPDEHKKYSERLDYELDIIIKMGFSGYFLIVSDFIKWSKINNIPVGPGRGSGAGSIVAWSLAITDLDPIQYGLLFERFLNPERVSMPDFDIDFCQERREEVIKYVQDKYGEDKTAQIITFGKLQAKAVLKDVGRVLQLPYKQVDTICKMIPFNPVNPVSLAQAIEMDPNLQQEKDNDPQIDKLLNIGLKLEGLHRHASTHAAGIVISNQNLLNTVPLYKDPKSSMPVVQYSMKYTELSGLVKFDFLGLKTLTTISKTVKIINETTNHNDNFDISTISEDDQETFKLLGSGNTIGCFQLESAGMRDCLKKLSPDKIEDLIALISLYRPGPMDNIPEYISSKHGESKVSYPHPMLEQCLKETFGVIIYQEQVMQIAQILAGYSLGQADLLRRAMGKKIKAEMDAQKATFVDGAVKNSIPKQKAEDIFELVAKFAGYGFNKSHAAAYAKIGYQTAYLKAHYPTAFITATLNLEIHDTDKINIFIQEAKDLGISISPPNINNSNAYFSIESEKSKTIKYGLAALKAIGLNAIQELETIRNNQKNKKFDSIEHFLQVLPNNIIQKRSIENLIKSGALDVLEPNRAKLLSQAELLVKYNTCFQQEKESNQASLFASSVPSYNKIELNHTPDFQQKEKLQYEFESIGFYLSEHPLDSLQEILKNTSISTSNTIKNIDSKTHDFTFAGVIISYKQRSGKNGRFVTLNISDPKGVLDVSLFDENLISDIRDLLFNGSLIVINATLRNDDNGSRIMINKLVSIEKYLEDKIQTINIHENTINNLRTIKSLIEQNPGNLPIELKIQYSWNKEIYSIFDQKKYYTNAETYKKLLHYPKNA